MKKSMEAALNQLRFALKDSEYVGRVFLAGGIVRDELMGLESKDIDLVVEGNINAGMECAIFIAHTLGCRQPVLFPTFGTAKLSIGDYEIEFVAARSEKYRANDRKPSVESGTLKADAFRRDFTVNSLFKDLFTGEIFDLTEMGLKDMDHKILRTTSEPNYILAEDPLRIMRAVRFCVKYNFDMFIDLHWAMAANADKLNNISKERVQDELNKILVLNNPSRAFRMMQQFGILKVILPELEALVGVTQNHYHKDDAFNHTLAVLDATPPELTRRLGALFHDCGKALTRTEKEGKVQFLNHAFVGAELAEVALKRLKYPNDRTAKVKTVVKYHMDLKFAGPVASDLKDKSLRKFVFRVGDPEVLEVMLDVMHADNVSHSEAHSMPEQMPEVRRRLALMDVNAVLNTKSPLDGHQLMALGVNGKMLGEMKRRLTDKVLEQPDFSVKQSESLVKSVMATKK